MATPSLRTRWRRVCLGLLPAALVVTFVGATSAADTAGASPASVTRCTGKELTAAYLLGGGAAGTRYGDLKITNTTSHRCRLDIAPHAMYFTASKKETRVGRTGTFEDWPTGSPRSHFVLSPRGGHVYVQIGIVDALNYGKGCHPVAVSGLVTLVRGSSTKILASLNGLGFQTCTNTKDQVLFFGRYRPHRATTG